MAANVQNAKNFLLTTDFPLDKVIYLNSGSVSIPGLAQGYTIQIPHHLPFIPLVGGSWDTTPDFQTNYDYYTGTIPSPDPTYLFGLELDISADNTNVILSANNLSASAKTVYYRIYALEPSDSSADLEPTASSGSEFILNTDNNYTKLYKEGVIRSPGLSSTTSIVHNLGYKPEVTAWWTYLGVLQPVSLVAWNFGDPYPVSVQVNSQTIDFVLGISSYIDRIDYRIYIDETGNGI